MWHAETSTEAVPGHIDYISTSLEGLKESTLVRNYPCSQAQFYKGEIKMVQADTKIPDIQVPLRYVYQKPRQHHLVGVAY